MAVPSSIKNSRPPAQQELIAQAKIAIQRLLNPPREDIELLLAAPASRRENQKGNAVSFDLVDKLENLAQHTLKIPTGNRIYWEEFSSPVVGPVGERIPVKILGVQVGEVIGLAMGPYGKCDKVEERTYINETIVRQLLHNLARFIAANAGLPIPA